MKLSKYIQISKENDKGIINKYLEIVDGGSEMSVKELISKGKEVVEDFKRQETKARFQNEVEGYFYKSPFTFSVAEWVDFENFMKAKDVAKALTVIYRNKEVSKLDKDVWEDWGGYSSKRSGLFLNVDAWRLLGALNKAVKEKEMIISSHKSIFNSDDFNYEEELKQADSEEAKNIIKSEKKKDEIRNEYNMELLILDVAGDDFTKIEKVMEMNINTLFHFIGIAKLKETL